MTFNHRLPGSENLNAAIRVGDSVKPVRVEDIPRASNFHALNAIPLVVMTIETARH